MSAIAFAVTFDLGISQANRKTNNFQRASGIGELGLPIVLSLDFKQASIGTLESQ
jgi:hypothetical protein